MNPSFNSKILQSFVPIFNGKTKTMLEKLDNEAGNNNFDILPFMNECTLDMVCGKFFSYFLSIVNTTANLRDQKKKIKILNMEQLNFTATTMGFDIDSRDPRSSAFLHSIEA